nr:tricarboxylate transporter [Pseudomonadota bacterium]
HGLWSTLAWFGGLLVMSGLFGFILALGVFLIGFFRLRAGLGWRRTILLSLLGIAFICFMAWVLNRDFPPGLLQNYSDLPWPLGGP